MSEWRVGIEEMEKPASVEAPKQLPFTDWRPFVLCVCVLCVSVCVLCVYLVCVCAWFVCVLCVCDGSSRAQTQLARSPNVKASRSSKDLLFQIHRYMYLCVNIWYVYARYPYPYPLSYLCVSPGVLWIRELMDSVGSAGVHFCISRPDILVNEQVWTILVMGTLHT